MLDIKIWLQDDVKITMSNFEIIRGQQIQNQEKVLAKKPNWIVGNKFGNSRIKVPNTVT